MKKHKKKVIDYTECMDYDFVLQMEVNEVGETMKSRKWEKKTVKIKMNEAHDF